MARIISIRNPGKHFQVLSLDVQEEPVELILQNWSDYRPQAELLRFLEQFIEPLPTYKEQLCSALYDDYVLGLSDGLPLRPSEFIGNITMHRILCRPGSDQLVDITRVYFHDGGLFDGRWIKWLAPLSAAQQFSLSG